MTEEGLSVVLAVSSTPVYTVASKVKVKWW